MFKFSGNAQRRRRHALVFHGTILYGFDLSLIDALLKFPSAQPEYRASRSHSEFVRNISAAPAPWTSCGPLRFKRPRWWQVDTRRMRGIFGGDRCGHAGISIAARRMGLLTHRRDFLRAFFTVGGARLAGHGAAARRKLANS